MSNSHLFKYRYSILGHLGMLILLCLSLTLWLERSITFDSSLYSYMICTREWVYTPHDRWINYLWQWIPILAFKMGVSLSTFLKVMSVSPILFLYFIYIVITHFLKNDKAGLYFVIFMIVLIRYKFYSAIPEIYIGMSFVALMAALLTLDKSIFESKSLGWKVGIGVLILGLNFTGHPLMFYPMAVVIGLDYLYKREWKSVLHIVLLGIGGLLFLIKYAIGKGSSHEAPVIQNFFNSVSTGGLIERTTDLYSLDIFMRYVETQWAFPLIVVLIMLVSLLIKRKFLFVLALLASSLIWVFFVVHLGAYLTTPYFFMIEGYFILMAPILFLPILYLDFKETWVKWLQVGIVAGLIGFGGHRILSVRPFYAERISDMREKVQMGKELDARNIIVPAGKKNWDRYWFLWSIPFESLMLSSLDYEEESSVLIIDTHPREDYFEQPFEVMIGVDTDTLDKLEVPYFNFDNSPFISIK